jgi:D-alanine--poly(phosphoribitol) ligase subunit 1
MIVLNSTNNNDSTTRNNLQHVLLNSLKQHADKPAFFFENTYYSYLQVTERVSQLQTLFLNNEYDPESIGIISNNDLDTYSAIVACLLSGITYVPIEPTHPDERNNYIIDLSSLASIYCSNITTLSESFQEQNRSRFLYESVHADESKEPIIVRRNRPAYILFTSGTTGLPKGVPITIENLEAFVKNIEKMGLKISNEDRFLQVFDLTFDLSVFSYLIPLLYGACVFPLPKVPFRYMLAVQLIEEKSITHILTVPSFISYIEPYFKEIKLPMVKHWLFCGEALRTKIVAAWRKCVPDANIFNLYGPTEATVFCTSYQCKADAIKDHKGVVCVGKPFTETSFELFNEDTLIAESGTVGELCISGRQLTHGYVNSDLNNKKKFFEYKGSIYYRTGDLCSIDADGDYFFEGRNDSQIKINGYRVELGEVENAALKIDGIKEAVAITVNELNSEQIILFLVCQVQYSETALQNYLKKRIPDYMMPRKFIFIGNLPYNLNGKIDKQNLVTIYGQTVY